LFGGYFYLLTLTGTANTVSALKSENKLLSQKLEEIVGKYDNINRQVDSLAKIDYQLRLASNLNPISEEERLLGIGGGSFDNSIDYLSDNAGKQLKKALSFVDQLSRKIEFEKSNYSKISEKLKENKKLFASIPAIKPAAGLALNDFGMRLHPILKIRRMHAGIDILANWRTPVYVTGDGKVQSVGYRGGYGLTVQVNHGFGYTTLYTHLSKALVKKGQKVKRGDLIAKSGSSGLSTGPHLHYEVRYNGKALNPIGFFFDDLDYFAIKKKAK
jgi:murein DD-endopeptidase MepM/ murein hydrolase activator NlpD